MSLVYTKTNSISFVLYAALEVGDISDFVIGGGLSMPRSGLTKKCVIESAAVLIENSGISNFSMRALADFLNIKTASLYNHVQSMDALLADVCAYALQAQYETELKSIKGKSGTEAIIAIANAYRTFAKEHCELYRLIINTAATCGSSLGEISSCITEPFMAVLNNTALNDTEKIHWQRILRGIIHGFVSQEDAGFFAHLPVDVNESFNIAIGCYIDGLKQAERRKAYEQIIE